MYICCSDYCGKELCEGAGRGWGCGNCDGWQYATLADAFVAAQNGYTICIISDIYDPSASIGYNDGEHNKHIIIDLNGKSVTLQMMNFDYSLYVKNGTLNCGITNGSVGFTNAMLTLSNSLRIVSTG